MSFKGKFNARFESTITLQGIFVFILNKISFFLISCIFQTLKGFFKCNNALQRCRADNNKNLYYVILPGVLATWRLRVQAH